MKKIVLLFTVFSAAATLASADERKPSSVDQNIAPAAGPAIARPNSLSFELGGRGILYGISYDRSLSDSIAVGIGFSHFTVTDIFVSNYTVTTIPVYGTFYTNPTHHRAFATVGLDYVTITQEYTGLAQSLGGLSGTIGKGSGIAAVLGAGYEYRADGGFLFRATPYLFVGKNGVMPFGGLTFGMTF